MVDEIKQSYLYWELLAVSKVIEHLKVKGLLPDGMEQYAMEDCKMRLKLSETVEELMDQTYLKHIIECYGHSMETSPLPIFQTMVKAKSSANIDPKYRSFAAIISINDIEITTSYALQGWLRSRNTTEVLTLWEKKYNPDFQGDAAKELIVETEAKSTALTLKQWIAATNSRGIAALQGRYGGTYAHPIIATDFEAWLSPKCRFDLCSRWFEKDIKIHQ